MRVKPSLFLACILFVLLSFSFFVNYTKATSSQCRGPSDNNVSAKRTLSAHVEEILESELLAAHMTLSTEDELNEDDLEYLHEVTNEEIHTLGFGRRFRRAFRRIRRVVRRIGRAVGRVVRAAVKIVKKLTGLFRRRKAAQIIANSVQNFNGYTGPTSTKWESRREFDGTLANTASGANQTQKSAKKVAKSVKKNKKSKKGILNRFGRKLGKRVANRLVSSMNKLLKKNRKTTTNNGAKTTLGSTSKCVACRVDCMKEYNGVGTIYSACTQRYYYYGCQAVAPCLKTSTADDDEIEGMVGICAYRNGCKFKSAWRGIGTNDVVTNKLIKKIRASGADPE